MVERRWTDERLDDRFAAIEARLKRMDGIPERMVALEQQVSAVRTDTTELLRGLRNLEERLEERAAQRQEEREAQRIERKMDRRWMVGTLLAATALIVSAVGLLVSQLG